MAEVQQMGPNQAQCWQCEAVVYKGTKNCPKCGAPSPAVSIATQRKVALISLRVGVPVGIVSLIAGIIMFLNVLGSGNLMQLINGGIEIVCLLLIIGISGVIVGPFLHFSLKKREKQLTAMRENQ